MIIWQFSHDEFRKKPQQISIPWPQLPPLFAGFPGQPDQDKGRHRSILFRFRCLGTTTICCLLRFCILLVLEQLYFVALPYTSPHLNYTFCVPIQNMYIIIDGDKQNELHIRIAHGIGWFSLNFPQIAIGLVCTSHHPHNSKHNLNYMYMMHDNRKQWFIMRMGIANEIVYSRLGFDSHHV